ncbi:helix-turn-helix domain-containing protein [Vibrio splendidus]|uniref:helix-turn-helix domain-containing protein n=1 Tax=Vibrio splendidus TaxID=29497 RepID=UPI000D339F43|nr:helix-turn-helix transcriptional regulator [Vibrio splendidus]PTP43168.1 transcriptional regulator [Vibrio splendidus]
MIHRALRVIRQYHDLSIAKLATDLQLPKPYIDGIEKGTKPVTEEILQKYSDLFDIPMTSLVMFSSHISNEKRLAKKVRTSLAGKVLKIAEWTISKDEKIEA